MPNFYFLFQPGEIDDHTFSTQLNAVQLCIYLPPPQMENPEVRVILAELKEIWKSPAGVANQLSYMDYYAAAFENHIST